MQTYQRIVKYFDKNTMETSILGVGVGEGVGVGVGVGVFSSNRFKAPYDAFRPCLRDSSGRFGILDATS